jgi:AcrR family transcriptional regulator
MSAPPPIERPRRARRLSADERRDEILHAAAECFSTNGYARTTTRDIARRVGVTEAALYRHFPGKQAIYTAILDRRMEAPDPVAVVEEAAQADDDAAVFRGLALHLLETVEADPTMLRLLLFSALEGHELARPFHEQRLRRLREFLTAYIDRRRRAGAFRDVEPALAARAFIGMVVDHLIVKEVFRQRDAYPQPAAEVATTFASIFLRGVTDVAPGVVSDV